MKTQISIPQPAWQQVPNATSKHARGRAPKRVLGSLKAAPGDTPGAFGRATKNAEAKQRFLSQSSAEANRIANEKQLAKAWGEFSSGLSGDDLELARANGVHVPAAVSDARQRKADSENKLEFADPAELPDSLGCGEHNGRKLVRNTAHPVDVIEPKKFSVEVEGLSEDEIRETSETFGVALLWALEDEDVVGRGRRAIALIAAMRPDLAAGIEIDRQLAFQLLGDIQAEFEDPQSAVENAGKVFGRFLEFIGRGPVKSAIGERLDITAYMLRPDLLPQNTLAKLGEILNKSRQAKSKLSNDVRDTFAGVKALAMRPEITRDRCRTAQLA